VRIFARAAAVLAVVWTAAVGFACGRTADAPRANVFTPARPTFSAAVNDFLGYRPEPQQPFPFPHSVHAAKQVACTEYCHEAVLESPRAGLPGVNACMGCHSQIATDRPLIKQIADMQAKGIDFEWQRVYGYTAQAHVRFNHAPHIRAKVECSTCHGNIAGQTVAQENVDLNMGFCVNCHAEKKASNDCLTCHY
jgi:hypothetical protein